MSNINAITGNSSLDSAQSIQVNAAAKTEEAKVIQKAVPAGKESSDSDTVQISAVAQAKAMKDQGQSVQQIAQLLGLSVTDVNAYLGITDATAKTYETAVKK